MSAPFFVIPCLILALLSGCGNMPSDPSTDNPIEEVIVFQQGDKLYANVRLQSDYLDKILKETAHGEPVLAHYRFQFYRQQNLFFDLRLSNLVIQRRLRLRLITERFEMMELPQRKVQYTADEDEALSFLGSPRYILLGSNVSLPRDNDYYLKIGFTMEYQGMPWVLEVLNRWLTMTPPQIHEKIVRFNRL